MKSYTILFLLVLIFVTSSADASDTIPMAISPGSDDGIAVVAQSCPTFSWTSVDWGQAYRIAVFEAVDTEILSYAEILSFSPPVISKEIRGRASSWTPSSEERLVVGMEYVWYVKAVDAYGQGMWSEGKHFKVDVGLRFEGVEEKVRERLEAQGASEEVIEDVLREIKSGVGNFIPLGVDSSSNNKARIQAEGEELDNTYFGLDAGISNTGLYGTFIGRSAGYANTTADSNTFVGYTSGYSNTTGTSNTFMGESSGLWNTTGNYNTFIGQSAGINNQTASWNTFIGQSAGYTNTTGYANIFLGFEAGYSNTLGYSNIFVGNAAGRGNTEGDGNTFIGYFSGFSNTTGEDNTFIGFHAGYSSWDGHNNTFLGYEAGKDNLIGSSNTFVGYNAGFKNTAHQNTFLGSMAGFKNTTGFPNTFLGHEAGYSNVGGSSNVFVGRSAGYSNDGGDFNTYVGHFAGALNTSGEENTIIGSRAGILNSIGSGNVFLGNNAGESESASNKLYIDNSNTSSPLIWGDFSSDIVAVNGQLGVGTQSPGYPMELERTGTNASIVVDRTDGAMNYINATASYANFGSVRSHPLRLVVNGLWTLRLDSDGSLTMKNGATCTTGGEWQNASSRELKENIRDLTVEEAAEALEGLTPVKFNYKADQEDESLGFIAEDVPDLVATKDRKGMSAMDVVAVLTKVVQDQKERDRKQQKVIEELRERVAELEKNK